MAATLLDGVTISDTDAKKIIKIAIEQNAYDGDMPSSKKERQQASHEIVAFCIDAWKNDGARPDDDDPEIAEGAEAILQIFEIAGIEVDDEDEIILPDAESDEDEDDEDEDEQDEEEDDDEDEGPFEPDDYIEGYTDLTTATKLKKIKALDPEDDEDAGILQSLQEWEEQQKKPNARVLDTLTDLIGDSEEDEEDDEDEEGEEIEGEVEDSEDEDDSDDEDDEDEDDDESEEPWPGYDKATAVKVKEVLNSEFEDGNLSEDHIKFVVEYENDRPQPRKRIITLCEQLLEQLQNADEDEDDDDAEEEEAPRSRKKAVKAAKTNGASSKKDAAYVITCELNDSELEIEQDGVFSVGGTVVDLLQSGATNIVIN